MRLRSLTIATLSTTLVVAACSSAQDWKKTGGTLDQAQRDYLQCDYEAEQGTPPSYQRDAFAAGVADGLRISQLRAKCLEARGYVRK